MDENVLAIILIFKVSCTQTLRT